jgi:transposase
MVSHIGCDVSKKKFDAALIVAPGKYKSKAFDNDLRGFQAFLAWIDAHAAEGRAQAHVCMESTGQYHEQLALHLHDHGLKVSIVNPLLVKRFMEVEGLRNKTDGGDAKAIARFCEKQHPLAWEAPSQSVRSLQALVARLDTLLELRQGELNRRDVAHDTVKPFIEQVIANLDGSIQAVKAAIASTIDDDPDLKQRQDLLQSIPGLGERTIPQLLAYIGRPERFKSVKALTAFASLTPAIKQSGTSLNKTKGTHPMGHRTLKRALYFPAMVAARHNPVIAAFWARLKAQNKPGKVIVVACMHKLLAIAYGVLKSKRPFDPTMLAAQTA